MLAKKVWLRSLNWIFNIQGRNFSSLFLMFDEPFCRFATFSGPFWRVYRNCFLCALRIVLKEKSFREQRGVYNEFRSWVENFQVSGKKNSAGMPKFHSISPAEHFEETMLWRRNILLTLSDFKRKTLVRWTKNFWLRSLNWKLHIQGIKFYLNSSFSMTRFVSFRILAEIFWRVCFLRALRIVLKRKSSFEQRSVF